MNIKGQREKSIFNRVLGIKKLNNRAAELYQLTSDYDRFNQKYHMVSQPAWKEEISEFSLARVRDKGLNNIMNGKGDTTILDWAFLNAGSALGKVADSPNNVANRGGNSWQPIGDSFPEGLKRWNASKDEAARLIKNMAFYYGADAAGICEYDRRYIYSHYYDRNTQENHPIKFSDEGYENISEPTYLEDGTAVIPAKMKYAIVLLHEMEYENLCTAPTQNEWGMVRYSYSKMAATGVSLAEFIRGLGYQAIPTANDTAAGIPLAIDAGLGQVGRHGKLISPVLGTRSRISKIFTDLPLATDSPIDFGVERFCASCTICADQCPVKAIPFGDKSYEAEGDYGVKGIFTWQISYDKCGLYFKRVGSNCGICIARCPYNREKGFKNWALTSLSATLPIFNRFQRRAVKPLSPGDYWRKHIKGMSNY